jgi:hypothetical protein
VESDIGEAGSSKNYYPGILASVLAGTGVARKIFRTKKKKDI